MPTFNSDIGTKTVEPAEVEVQYLLLQRNAMDAEGDRIGEA